MMKRTRLVILAVVLMGAVAVTASAKGSGWAVGGEVSLMIGDTGGLPAFGMVTFHVPQIPLMFGVGISSSSPLVVGATVDYWFAHGNLSSLFSWYAGVGGYLQAGGDTTAVGGRIPLGLQVWPVGSTLEIFAELAPAVGVTLAPTAFALHVQGAAGLRVWL